jgi:hypothetical protein
VELYGENEQTVQYLRNGAARSQKITPPIQYSKIVDPSLYAMYGRSYGENCYCFMRVMLVFVPHARPLKRIVQENGINIVLCMQSHKVVVSIQILQPFGFETILSHFCRQKVPTT